MKLRKGASAQAGPVAQGIAAAEGWAASAMVPSGLAMVFILFGLVAATQGGGSVAAMAGFCWMLAVNLVQDSASHMRCVMA